MSESRWPVAASDADFEPFLTGQPEVSVQMFWCFVAMARACGAVIFELQNGPIVLRGTRRIFASVHVGANGLDGHVNLARQVTDPRIRKVEALTKRLYFHRYRVRSIADLDEEFGRWLCEARSIGDGAHLNNPPSG